MMPTTMLIIAGVLALVATVLAFIYVVPEKKREKLVLAHKLLRFLQVLFSLDDFLEVHSTYQSNQSQTSPILSPIRKVRQEFYRKMI